MRRFSQPRFGSFKFNKELKKKDEYKMKSTTKMQDPNNL